VVEAQHQIATRKLVDSDAEQELLEHLIESAVDDHQAWEEIGELIEQRRRLTESESKRMVALEQMLTAEQAMALVHRVVDIVSRHVTDKQALRDIIVEMRTLTEATSGRTVYEEAPDA
jgi:Spy/CpxP family protein refolding chaperone